MPAGQGVSDDHTRSIDAQMELLPAPRPAASMFHGRPFTFTDNGEPGAVDDKMDARACGDATQRQGEPLCPAGQCGVIGRGQVEAQHPEDRPQKALRLAEGQVKEQAERQCCLDGDVRVLQLPAPRADTRGLPPGDRLRRQPERDVASLNQRPIVRRPASDAVFRCVLGMHSRLHVEIMLRRPVGRHDDQAATNSRFRALTPLASRSTGTPTSCSTWDCPVSFGVMHQRRLEPAPLLKPLADEGKSLGSL